MRPLCGGDNAFQLLGLAPDLKAPPAASGPVIISSTTTLKARSSSNS
jgi:hypothetical protein